MNSLETKAIPSKLLAAWAVVGVFYIARGFGIFGDMNEVVSLWGMGMFVITGGVSLCWLGALSSDVGRFGRIIYTTAALLLILLILPIQIPPLSYWLNIRPSSDTVGMLKSMLTFETILPRQSYIMTSIHIAIGLSALVVAARIVQTAITAPRRSPTVAP